jgi:biotin operon repressor
MNRHFKGVWIPKEIYLDRTISWTEKILLIEINSLQGEEGCWASNEYLAEFLGIKETTVANLVSKLKSAGLLVVEGYGKTRRLFVPLSRENESNQKSHEKVRESHEKVREVSRKNETPIYRINNTENNTVVVQTATADSAFDLYRKYYPQVPLHIFNQEMLMSLEKHLDVFKEVLDIWVGRQYREQNIKGMMSLYERLLTDKNTKEQKLFCEKCEGNSGWLPEGEGWVRCQH